MYTYPERLRNIHLCNKENMPMFFDQVEIICNRLKDVTKPNCQYSLFYSFWFDSEVLACIMIDQNAAVCTRAHGYDLYYYDNKKNGEVDFLIDDPDSLSNIPIEVKSGKDYTVHSALNKFLSIAEYNIQRAYVLSNERQVYQKDGITYAPIYNIMFFHNNSNVVGTFIE